MTSNLSTFCITLVRHGETAANKARIIQGQIEVNLNIIGRKQAELLAKYYKEKNIKFDLVYTSNLKRAVDTCQIITADYQEKIKINKLLIERDFGKNEGKPLEELYETAKKAGYDIPSKFTPEGAESIEIVNQRVRKFCNTILVDEIEPNFNVLVVAHGGVIREFHRYFKKQLKINFSGLEPFKITPNTALNIFKINYKDKNLISGECIKLHDTPHLNDYDFSQLIDEEEVFDINKVQKGLENKTAHNFIDIQKSKIELV